MNLAEKREVNVNKHNKILTMTVISATLFSGCGRNPGQASKAPDTIQTITVPAAQPRSESSSQQGVPPKPNGTISSGGGHIFGSKVNPWFLPEQSKPTWCLEIDEAAFGTTRKAALETIDRALKSWEVVSRVSMVQRECDAAIDLRFKLGNLTEEAAAQLSTAKTASREDHLDTAAIAIRTHYDEEKLRGRGFIQVAAAKGPEGLEAKGMVRDPWSIMDGALLLVTIQHELGHVFGLQHSQASDGLMGARTIEYLLDAKTHEQLKNNHEEQDRFLYRLGLMAPINLVAFPEETNYEKCKDGQCQDIKIVSMNNRLIVEQREADTASLASKGRAAWRVTNTATLVTYQSGLKPISTISFAGERKEGILASQATYGGISDNGTVMILNWTAGSQPSIVEFKGGHYTVLLP